MYTADTLSRAPTALPDNDSNALQEEVEGFVSNVTKCLPAMESKLQSYRSSQASDPECAQIMKAILDAQGAFDNTGRSVLFRESYCCSKGLP